MTNEELVSSIQDGKDVRKNTEILFDQCSSLIRSFVYSRRSHYSGFPEADKQDFYQECCIAFLEAVSNYNPDRGMFSTYLMAAMRNRISRYLDNCCSLIRVPVFRRRQLMVYGRLVNDALTNGTEMPPDAQIRAEIGLNDDALEEVRRCYKLANIESLDAPIKSSDDDSLTRLDQIPDDANPIDAVIDAEAEIQLKSALYGLIDKMLDAREKDLVLATFKGEKTLADYGKEHGLSRERMRQIRQQALRKLDREHLRQMAADVYGIALRGSLKHFNDTWDSSTEKAALLSLRRTTSGLVEMQARGLTTVQIAKRLGVSQRTVQRRLAAERRLLQEDGS